MRMFLALKTSDEVRAELGKLQSTLRVVSRGRGTWTAPENFHLTLAFLGEITMLQAQSLAENLAGGLQRHGDFALTLDRTGFFNNPDSATVWCSVNPEKQLRALSDDCRRCARQAGIRLEGSPFRAHITLGRKINILRCNLDELKPLPLSWQAGAVTLFKSTLRPEGPIYEEFASVEL